jgi:hypothetical protein
LLTVHAGLSLAAAALFVCAIAETSTASAPAHAAVAHEIAETAPAESFETFLDRLMMAESAGHASAKNPRSSALGTFQFIKSTFLDVARRHFSAEVEGFVDDKILALRTDRDFARRAAAAFSRDNLNYLKAQGLAPTFADLRLAFLLGPADATRVLKADPQTPAVAVLSPPVIKANPFMQRMNAADLRLKSIRDVERGDRRELVDVAPQPLARPAARVRPPASPLTVMASKPDCRRASCRKFSALQSRKGSARAGRKT